MNFQEIALHLTSNNISALENQLQKCIADPSNINLENTEVIKLLLQTNNDKVLQLSVQIVAELAKNTKNRNVLTSKEITYLLLKQLQPENSNFVYHTFRAIGNICFENENACSLIGEDYLQRILNTIKCYQSKNQHDVVYAGWGVMVNLLTTSEELLKLSLKQDVLDLIESALSKTEIDDSIVQQLLVILNSVSDELQGTQQQHLKKLCYDVIKIMKTTTNLEIGALCLEFLFGQAESRNCLYNICKSFVIEIGLYF